MLCFVDHCLIVLSLCWCCIVCSSSSIFSFLCYVLWTMCLIVLSLCWCCIVCFFSSIFSFLCYVLWTFVLLYFLFVDVVFVCSSSSIFSFLCYVLWTIVLFSLLFVDVVLYVPLPQSLVFYVMFCGPLSPIFQLYRSGQFYQWRKPPTDRKSLTMFIT